MILVDTMIMTRPFRNEEENECVSKIDDLRSHLLKRTLQGTLTLITMDQRRKKCHNFGVFKLIFYGGRSEKEERYCPNAWNLFLLAMHLRGMQSSLALAL